MSHTEVYDPRATERALVNEVNRAARHCRVGKIVWKYRGPFDPNQWLPKPHQPPLPYPLDGYRFRGKHIDDFTDPCAGCVGKACGNVACPKRAVVTC